MRMKVVCPECGSTLHIAVKAYNKSGVDISPKSNGRERYTYPVTDLIGALETSRTVKEAVASLNLSGINVSRGYIYKVVNNPKQYLKKK
jgi:hypothetical protein